MVLTRKLPTGARHNVAVIPSRIQDNRILLEADPGYIDRLHMVGSDALVRAWLGGGPVEQIEGAFFELLVEQRTSLRRFAVPERWIRVPVGGLGATVLAVLDWLGGRWCRMTINWTTLGSTWADRVDRIPKRSATSISGRCRTSRTLPRSAACPVCREWYGSVDPRNMGSQGLNGWRSRLQRQHYQIVERGDPQLSYGVLDPSAFAQDGGP